MFLLPILCPLYALFLCVPLGAFGRRLPNKRGNGSVGAQDQVKTGPSTLLTPRGVNTPSGFTHEKGGVWGGGGLVFHHLSHREQECPLLKAEVASDLWFQKDFGTGCTILYAIIAK